MPDSQYQDDLRSLEELLIWDEMKIKKARYTYELLYDLEPNKKIIESVVERGVDLFSFIQRDFITSNRSLLYAKSKDNVAILKIKDYNTWWNEQISKKTRNSIRKAEKSGIHISIFNYNHKIPDDVFVGICKIYNETPIRQGRYFSHYGINLEAVKNIIKNENRKIELHCTYLNGELVGFSELIYGERVAQISQILSMMKYFEKAPNNALLSSIVKRCAEFNYPFIIYGRMGLAHPTLTKFKESNGFQQFDFNRYFIPLTHKGAVAIKLGLHRQLKDIIPETIKYSLLPLFSFISRNFKVEL